MSLTIKRFVRFENEGALKAFCDVVVGNQLLIKGIRVVEGRHGPFISMPRQQGKEGKWYDSVVPLNKDLRAELARLILEAYRTRMSSICADG